jgi:hypothetical protein
VYQAGYYNTYRNYYGQPETPSSPSDAPLAPMDDVMPPPAGHAGYIHQSCDPVCAPSHGGCNSCCAPACGCESACGCGNGCSDCCEDECEDEEDEVIRLFGDIPLPGHRSCCSCEDGPVFTIAGWMNGGITGNTDGNRSGTGNFPVPFNYVSDGPILNQLWIYGEKLVDTGGEGLDWGFRVDYMFGNDSRFTNAFGDHGWDFDWQSSRDYGSAIPQLYGEVGFNNVTVRVGHFFTIIGYEVVQATGNFFYSHAYTHQYGEPFTHTGALGKWTPDDVWTLYGGYVFGWDSGFENLNEAHTYLGGISYAWEDIGTLGWMVNAGDWGDGGAFPGASTGDIYMSSLIGTVNLTDDIQWVIEHDHGVNNNVPGGPGAEWYGINNYLFITLTDYVNFGGRIEWFDDADGARVGAVNPAGPGAEGDYYAYTIGLNIRPHANFVVRPEMRYDWFDGTAPVGAEPYDSGTEDDLLTFGVDGVLQY